MLPFAVQQLVEGGGEGKGVLPDKLVGSDTPGFGVFGIGVERDAGHIEKVASSAMLPESVTIPLAWLMRKPKCR